MKRIVAYLALTLVLAMLVLFLLSWLLSATTDEGVHSLLSAEGVRFFFGGFVAMMQKPLLVWLLLLSMAWGGLRSSGLLTAFRAPMNMRQRQALLLLSVILVVYVGVILLLTAIPHAVLLSSTGSLWPSAFSRALVPIVAFGVVLLSVVYGLVSRRFLSMADICDSLIAGIASAAPLLLLYVLAVQFYDSLLFVFGS